MVKLRVINLKNIVLINKLLKTAGKSLETFRYFSTRNIGIVKQHIITVVLEENENIIGYGHLDEEDNIVWLGLMVSEKYKSMGYGSYILQFLIEYSIKNDINKIKLSVDKGNTGAIYLYEKNGFKKVAENEISYIYTLEMGE